MVKNIIVLHGWAISLNRGWPPFLKQLRQEKVTVWFPKIPGLTGKDLQSAWYLSDYADWLEKWIEQKGIKNYVVLGHSFGGNMAIKYALKKPAGLKGLILVSSAGIRTQTWQKNLVRAIGKFLKYVLLIPPLLFFRDHIKRVLYRLIGSHDYVQATGFTKETLANCLKEDLAHLLKEIQVPTLLLWGQDDKDTPLSDAHKMEQEIKNSRLVIFPDATHALPFQKTKEVIKETVKFMYGL